ncbi:MAG: NAD(P)-binding domain-containing protein, partial [Coriobacteriia bacterium]|nr:NAD(P)-binding domain-containing protein [Coriobacteriia bacterium]
MLAIIGGGKMGEAIVAGLVQGAGFDPAGVQVAEPFTDRCELITELYGVRCVADGAMIDAPETVIIAVKPQIIREVLAALAAAEGFQPSRVVSIAAGVTSDLVRSYFPDCAVIRVMPNLALS